MSNQFWRKFDHALAVMHEVRAGSREGCSLTRVRLTTDCTERIDSSIDAELHRKNINFANLHFYTSQLKRYEIFYLSKVFIAKRSFKTCYTLQIFIWYFNALKQIWVYRIYKRIKQSNKHRFWPSHFNIKNNVIVDTQIQYIKAVFERRLLILNRKV